MTFPSLALNGRFSGTRQPTGTQVAAFHLFDAIIRAERDLPVVVFADPRFEGVAAWAKQPRTTLVTVPFQDWSRARAQFWEQIVLLRCCRQFGCELVHHPITTNPWWHSGVRSIVTVHDLNFLLHPEWFTRSFRLSYRFLALAGLPRADCLVAVSDYVRQHLRENLPIPDERLARIYNGVKPLPVSNELAGKTPAPSILCVGSLQPHKNLIRLVQAFLRIRTEFPNLELWVVGRPQSRFRRQPELVPLLNQPGVKLLGYLSENELGQAYRQAQLFCYPSLEEGFGLPVLEAMMAGTPVVTSNCSCLPEIAGPAAEFVDPTSVASVATGMRRVLGWSPQERMRRCALGREWAGRFTWMRAAQEYIELYRRCLSCP